EVNNVLVDGEVIERKQAREAYEAAVRQAFDPALLEWIDGRTFRARIFPIPAAGDRRVVLSYIELLPTVDGRTHYVYPMGGGDVQIQEFSLAVDLGDEGKKMTVATTADARIEGGGERVTVRRSGYKPQGDFLLEMTARETEPLRAMRVASSRAEAAYVMLRYTPDVSWDEVKKVPGDVVVVVDTSAGGDDAERQLRSEVAEAILRALSTSDRFAVMAADLEPRILWPDKELAPADEGAVAKGLERLAGVRPGGATDLGALFDVALRRLHGANQPAVVYIGDGRPTVGELHGDALAERLTRSVAGSSARLFTIAVGAQANHSLLQRLARIGGGASFRVDQPEQAVQEALRFVGNLKTPTITDLKLDLGAGLDQVFSSAAGKVSRGQEVTLLARTHHPLPDSVKVSGSFAGKPFAKTHRLSPKSGRDYSYVPTLWARRYLQSLMGADLQKNRGVIIRLGTDYALMTPFTSFLVLESEDQYQRMGIKRRVRDPIWGLVPQAALTLPDGLHDGVSDGMGAAAAAPLALFGCDALGGRHKPVMTEEQDVAMPKSYRGDSASKGSRGSHAVRMAPSPTVAAQPAAAPAGATAGPVSTVPTDESTRGDIDRLATGGGSSGGRAVAKSEPAGARVRIAGEEGKMAARPVAPGRHAFAQPPRPARDLRDPFGGAKDKAKQAAEKEADNEARNARAANLLASLVPVDYCSDASRRPLAHRRALWASQLDQAGSLAGWISVYRRAQAHCEVPHQRDRHELLDLIQLRVTTPAEVSGLLAAIQDPKSQDFVRRQLLRRAVTPEMASVSAYAESVNWGLAEAALAKTADPGKRVAELRKVCAQYPQSVGCAIRLIRALVAAGKPQEALPIALKLREDGRASPALMQEIGDLMVAAGRKEEAMRAYSELVEFAPADPAARQLLGDIYLRHGWCELAYRQCRTLTEYRPDDPAAILRLAAAGAGGGGVDEAQRLERKVSGGEGEPGATDPRRWARLWSAARTARLMAAPGPAGQSEREGMERSLRRLQVLNSPGVAVILTWEDLAARLALALGAVPLPDVVNAGPAGLFAATLPPQTGAGLAATVTSAGVFRRPVRFQITVIAWDGQRLTVRTQEGSLPAGTAPAPGKPAGKPPEQALTITLPAR
ncbi:MAG: VWA domain-containing protein, partial [Deltaproteobacteria bacterium]|nr:VWA domain-containing protein [Deltaproteobacteria bacterium]